MSFSHFGVAVEAELGLSAGAILVKAIERLAPARDGWGKLSTRFVSARALMPISSRPGQRAFSESLVVGDGTVQYIRNRFTVSAHISGPRELSVTAFENPRIDRKVRQLALPRGGVAFEIALSRLRECVWLPWMWMARRWAGVVTTHGAVASGPAGALVILGLNGSGKSTLCSSLAQRGAIVLSDNYASISKDGLVLPFPELSRARATPVGTTGLFRAYNKSYFVNPQQVAAGPARLAGVVLLERTGETSLRELTAGVAARQATILQELTPEVVEGSPWAMLDSGVNWEARAECHATHEQALRDRFEAVPCFSLSWNQRDQLPAALFDLISV